MNNRINWSLALTFVLIFLGLELASFLAYLFPFFNIFFFFLILFLGIFLSIYQLEWGLLMVFAELILGSKGYLFYLPITSHFTLSLRIALWSAFILVFAYKFYQDINSQEKREKSLFLKNLRTFSFKREYILLTISIILGLLSALIFANKLNLLFSDFNAWLYFLLLIPVIAIRPKLTRLLSILLSSIFVLSLKTFILFNIFSLASYDFSLLTYKWLRQTLVGEMTVLNTWNRVFIQSQIFIFLAYFFLLLENLNFMRADLIKPALRNKYFYLNLFAAGFFLSSIIISLSRSFWLAGSLTLLVLLIIAIYKFSKKQIIFTFFFLVLSFILAISLIKTTTLFSPELSLENQLKDRISETNESAISSRWSQLGPLARAISKNPITGQGFGATVTYQSSDPRVLATNLGGVYTTYAFEWGYLDILLKTGLVGLFAYLYLIFSLLQSSWHQWRASDNYSYLALFLSLIFIAMVHIFTPYLNHPLGIGFIILSSCLILKNKVY